LKTSPNATPQRSRVTKGAAAALGAVWSADPTTAYSNIPVTNLTMVSSNEKAALIKNNVKTMGDLANLDPAGSFLAIASISSNRFDSGSGGRSSRTG
jgi:hypothetical protein